MARFLLNLNLIQPEIKRRCRICRSLFCCDKCRGRHEQAKHPQKRSILIEMEMCDICSGHLLMLNPNIRNDQLFDHIAKMHLPAYCSKCLRVFLSRADLTRVGERCNTHELEKHKALDFIEKPDISKILTVSTSNNNNDKSQNVNCEHIASELVNETSECTVSVCGQTKDTGITTSTPMAASSNSTQRPLESPQVSDIASPSSDMELTQGAASDVVCQSISEKKPGILVKGTRAQTVKKSRVKFAASPLKPFKESSIYKKRIIKYTPRREFPTNPRFLEILKGFEANKLGPQPPAKPGSFKNEKKRFIRQKEADSKIFKGEILSEQGHPSETPEAPKNNNKEATEQEVLCTKCVNSSDNKNNTSSAVKIYNGTPSLGSSGPSVASTSNNFTPYGISQFSTNLARTALTEKFANFRESPETTGNETGASTTSWFTPMNTMVTNDLTRNKLICSDVDQDNSPLDLKSNNVFPDLQNYDEENKKEESGGIWSSVTGVVKSAFSNIQGLVLRNGSLGNFKRSHSVSFEPSSVSPQPILKRSRSGDSTSSWFMSSTAAQKPDLSMKVKSRKPLRKKI